MKVIFQEWSTPDIMPITCECCGKRELSSIAARIGWTFTADEIGNTSFVCPDCRTDNTSTATIKTAPTARELLRAL